MSARRKASAPKPEETSRTACDWIHNFSASITIGNGDAGLTATLRVRNGEVDVVLSRAIDRDKLGDAIVELVSIARPAVDAIPFPF